jgi:hypothetical protein
MVGAGSATAAPSAPMRIAGRVTLVSSICGGGAAVTREMLERLPPPQPIPGRAFLVVAGEQISAARPAARFVTRPDGSFVTRLPPGKWCFFEATRRPSGDERPDKPVAAPSPHADGGCLAERARRCDLVLAVKSDVSRADITFRQPCPQPWNQPCYRGPMPP